MSPVAYKLSQTGRANPIVVVINPFHRISADYRLKFLSEECSVQVISIYDFHPILPVLPWVANLLVYPAWGKVFESQRLLLLQGIRKYFYGRSWARRILEQYNPITQVFEWTDPTTGVPGEMVAAGHALGIPSLSLPHGVFVLTTKLTSELELRDGLADRSYFNLFDRTVFQSYLHADRGIEEGIDPTKIVVLGSTRYCAEWQRINLRIQGQSFNPSKGEGCTHNVVFMVTQWTYNVNFEATVQTLRRLAAERWIHLVLKPHPREVEERPLYIRDLESLPNVEISAFVPSPALIEWADTVLVSGSDIALEVLAQGKNHVHPHYLHRNTTVFQDAKAEWQVENDDELIDALQRLSRGDSPPYGKQEVKSVTDRMVQGDQPGADILQRYADFLLSPDDFPVLADIDKV